jgi:hypothetical protein
MSNIGEIFLTILSFIFNKVLKFIIGNVYTIYLIFNQKKAKQWRLIDRELVKSALNRAVLITKAPRWNTHAIIGTLGPFSVQKSLSIDLKSANDSTRSWIAIIYSFPGYKTITSLESTKITVDKDWQSIPLKTGKYHIGIRYYNWSDSLSLPGIKVDGADFVNAQTISPNNNQFYHELIKYKNWFYLWLHYYIYTILRFRKYLAESFLKKEYLPVGATDTKFFYDYLDKHQTLQIEVDEFSLANYDIYVTLYDRCSLPVTWFQMEELQQKTVPLDNKGYYLIRTRHKSSLDPNFEKLNIQLTKN